MKINGIALPATSKRLSKIYDEAIVLADSGKTIVDVGADHGYLSAMLSASNKFAKVVATDISAPSLKKTQNLANQYGLKIECVVGDGLRAYPEADIACVCGMGGLEIIKILSNYGASKLGEKTSNHTCQKFVLQPVQNATELRLWLIENNYKIVRDYLVEDKGKFYFILVVDGLGKNKYTVRDKLFGKTNISTPTGEFKNYILDLQNRLKFLDNFAKIKTTKENAEALKQKQKYYRLVKKLAKEMVNNDTRNN